MINEIHVKYIVIPHLLHFGFFFTITPLRYFGMACGALFTIGAAAFTVGLVMVGGSGTAKIGPPGRVGSDRRLLEEHAFASAGASRKAVIYQNERMIFSNISNKLNVKNRKKLFPIAKNHRNCLYSVFSNLFSRF